jgi:hypothetical protein
VARVGAAGVLRDGEHLPATASCWCYDAGSLGLEFVTPTGASGCWRGAGSLTGDRLDRQGITFLTLRRRSPNLIAEIDDLPPSAWHTVNLEVPSRKYRTPQVYEQKVCLRKCTYRQFFIRDLSHDQPTILVTNERKATARLLILCYAKRMLIENALADAVRFFHIDALSSSVGLPSQLNSGPWKSRLVTAITARE